MDNGHKTYTAAELDRIIDDYIGYWSDPFGKGDLDVAAANVLTREALPIALQLLTLLKGKC